MEKILQLTSDPSWWFSSVFVGLILGVSGTFLARYIENNFKSRFDKRAAQKQKSDEERQFIAEILAANPTSFIVFMHFTQRVLTFSIVSGAVTLLSLFFGALVQWSPGYKLIIFALGFIMAVITVMFFKMLNTRLSTELVAHRIYNEKFTKRVEDALQKNAEQLRATQ